jgi:LmbE family N-acetylglucosaminyl deacetylase
MKNIAICVAHADDELLSCSGIISRVAAYNLVLVYASKSDYVDLDGTVYRTHKQVIDERLLSLTCLCQGNFPSIVDLGYDTKAVPYSSKIIEELDNIFRIYNIDTVFTHSPDDTHHDHANVGKATFTAARRIPNLFTFEPIFPAQGITLFHPNIYLDISNTYENKINALKAQKSQYEKYGKKWLDAIDALSRLRGIESGVERAECFSVIKHKMEL